MRRKSCGTAAPGCVDVDKKVVDRSRPRLRCRILWHRHSCLCLLVGCIHSRPSMTCPAWSRHPERRSCARDRLRRCHWFTNPSIPCHVERSKSAREGESKHPENVSTINADSGSSHGSLVSCAKMCERGML